MVDMFDELMVANDSAINGDDNAVSCCCCCCCWVIHSMSATTRSSTSSLDRLLCIKYKNKEKGESKPSFDNKGSTIYPCTSYESHDPKVGCLCVMTTEPKIFCVPENGKINVFYTVAVCLLENDVFTLFFIIKQPLVRIRAH